MFRSRQKKPTLISQVCEVKNLVDAWRKVRSNVRVDERRYSQGVDMVSLQEFEANWKENMAELAMALEDGTYLPMPVKQVQIRKKDGGIRTISILAIQDRIAQRAVLNVLEPIFEEVFLDCSYGFRPGRSAQDAVERIIDYRAKDHTWVVDADIASFFDSIDHDILMTLLRQHLDDQEILRLLKLWLKVGVLGTAAAEEEDSRKGIAIPFETLFGLTKGYIERVVDWGIEQLLEREEVMPIYPSDEEEVEVKAAEEVAREEGLRRLSKDLLLVLLSFSRPILKRAKELPSLRAKVKRVATPRNVALGVAVTLLGALIPVARKSLSQEVGPVGTPQGGGISPLLANVYLHEFDVAMTKKGYKLVRYADDFVVLCHAEDEARQALANAERVLASLRLKLNPAKTRIVPFDEGFHFLGATFAGEGVVEKTRGSPLTERIRAFAESGYEATKQGAAKIGEHGKAAFQKGKSLAKDVARASRKTGKSLLERGKRRLRGKEDRDGGAP